MAYVESLGRHKGIEDATFMHPLPIRALFTSEYASKYSDISTSTTS